MRTPKTVLLSLLILSSVAALNAKTTTKSKSNNTSNIQTTPGTQNSQGGSANASQSNASTQGDGSITSQINNSDQNTIVINVKVADQTGGGGGGNNKKKNKAQAQKEADKVNKAATNATTPTHTTPSRSHK